MFVFFITARINPEFIREVNDHFGQIQSDFSTLEAKVSEIAKTLTTTSKQVEAFQDEVFFFVFFFKILFLFPFFLSFLD